MAPPEPEAPEPLIDLPELTYMPAQAELIAHVDIQRLLKSPLWRENQGLMTEDPEAKRTLDALATCDLRLGVLRSFDLAVDSHGQRVIASLQGKGIGDSKRLECIGKTLFAGDTDRWTTAMIDGKPTIRLDGGAAIGHIVTDDRLVFASSNWDAELRERISGGGRSPATGPLGEALLALKTDRSIWFAGRLPQLGGQAENLRSLSGAVDLDRGLALELSMVAATPTLANEISAEMKRRLDNMRTRLKDAQLPEAAIDNIEIEVQASTVHLRASLEIAEITAIRTLLTRSKAPSTNAGRTSISPSTAP
ncbi:MAG TPA: hypothetical protein ENJ18_06565 [Nannocystis exedens]|nr:hypothetical protein [Nannocystis exedens]